MKKSLLALAAMGAFAGGAQAQSSVTVFGLIDAGIVQTNVDYGVNGVGKQSQTAIGGLNNANGTGTLSGSRLGFRGVEDLGGGMTAGFHIETALNYSQSSNFTTAATMTDSASANNGGALFASVRQAYASLGTKDFGQLRIGTQHSLGKDTMESIDPLGGVTLTGAGNQYQNAIHGFSGRYSQALTYFSPNMGGLSGRLQTIVDGTPSNNGAGTTANATPTSNRANAASLDFTKGAIKLAGYYERKMTWYQAAGAAANALVPMSMTGATAAVIPVINAWSLGGSYDFKVVKPSIMYFSQDATVGSVAQTGKTSGTQLGATVPVSAAATLFASYTTGSVTNNSSSLYDTAGMQLVGNYNLSKRTGIYAAYGQTDWKTKNSTVTSSVKYTSYGVGMRHSF
jgi:predicted porin